MIRDYGWIIALAIVTLALLLVTNCYAAPIAQLVDHATMPAPDAVVQLVGLVLVGMAVLGFVWVWHNMSPPPNGGR